MTLYELAYACRLYQGPFDDAYSEMRSALGDNSDLASGAHQDGLMKFLNDWRCRIAERNFPALKEQLQRWATSWISQLPEAGRDILSLTDVERTQIGNAFDSLMMLGAGLHFQDTAAAKTLHALRPNALPMWDEAIKKWFNCKIGRSKRTAGQTYSEFIVHVAQKISELRTDVERLGYSPSDVPRLVERPGASLVKLVDEYHWTTITNGHKIPERSVLEQWLRWESGTATAAAPAS